MALNNEYKILNDVLGVMNTHSIWICISELKTEIFISDISMRGVNLELVLSKLYKDGYIEVEIRKSRYTCNTEKHYRISFDGNIFLKRGGYLLGNLSQTIQQQPSKEEQVKDAGGVQPIKDITPLKPLMNTTNENEFIVVVNSIYDLVKYNNEKTPDKMKIRFTTYLLFHKGWLVENIGNQNAYIDIILNYFGYKRTTKDEKNFKFHLIKKNEFKQNKTKYMAIFNLLIDKENKTKSTEPLYPTLSRP